MTNFTSKEMSDLLYTDLTAQDSGIDVVLQTPTTKSKFPCRVINTPLESVIQSENAEPVIKSFQVTIEHWAGTPRECMEMSAKTDTILRARNFIRTTTVQSMFDEVTKKYRLLATYENKFYAVNDSFEVTR